ncbi:tRNA (guanine-N1)-methyltransferase [Geoglobus sp.]
MRLRDIFTDFLKAKGITCISTNSRKVLDEDPIQYIARKFASGEFRIREGEGRYRFDLNGNRIESCSHVAWRFNDGIGNEEIREELERFPYIVVDCSLKDIHTEKELKSLVNQIQKTLSVVRRFMWDDRLVIAGMTTPVSAPHYPSVEDFLKEKMPESVILLDPRADELFEGERADCYIIGGIVDKVGNKAGTTERIYRRLKERGFEIERRKILLRGDVVGVPDRINHIAEIILKSVINGVEVERAIFEVQNRKIARWRLRREIARNCERVVVNGRKFRLIRKSFFSDLHNWLNVIEDDFYRCARDMGVIVVDDSFTPPKSLKVTTGENVDHG